jgi:hypothetical protein
MRNAPTRPASPESAYRCPRQGIAASLAPPATLAALAALACLDARPARAADINSLQTLTQAEFRLLSEDLGAALSYKPMIPSAPLGITGFDLGIALTGTKLKNEDVLRKAASGDAVSTLPVPTLRLDKGLPLDIDVAVAYANIPNSNLRYLGGELRWAILAGGVAEPAVALRVSHTQLGGVSQLGFQTNGVDISVSKGFALFTPYAGVGEVWSKSKPKGVPGLQSESLSKSKVFAGLNVNFGVVNLDVEADSTGGTNSYGAKIGFRF